jgi:hypothetical protein
MLQLQFARTDKHQLFNFFLHPAIRLFASPSPQAAAFAYTIMNSVGRNLDGGSVSATKDFP